MTDITITMSHSIVNVILNSNFDHHGDSNYFNNNSNYCKLKLF